MKDEVKQQLNQIIGETRWMTPELAKRMAQKAPKRRNVYHVIVLTAVVVAALCFFFISTSPAPTSIVSQPTYVNEQAVEVLMDYFDHIQHQTLEEAAVFVEQQQWEALYDKYADVTWASLQILSETSSDDSWLYHIVSTHTKQNEQFIHSIRVIHTSDTWIVYENVEEDWAVYRPFSPPEALLMNYQLVRPLVNVGDWSTKQRVAPSLTIAGESLSFYPLDDEQHQVVWHANEGDLLLGTMKHSDTYAVAELLPNVYALFSDTANEGLLIAIDPFSVRVLPVRHIQHYQLLPQTETILFRDMVVYRERDSMYFSYYPVITYRAWEQDLLSVAPTTQGLELRYEDVHQIQLVHYTLNAQRQFVLENQTVQQKNR